MIHPGFPWDFALILAALGILVPWRGAVRVREILRRTDFTSRERLALYASTIAFQWLAAAAVLWRALARGYSAASLALAIPDPPLVWTITPLLVLLLAANQIFGLKRFPKQPAERQEFLRKFVVKLMPQGHIETLAFVALATTVSICEEFLYRGFVQALLEQLSGIALVGILGAALFFAAAHLYQGTRGVTSTFLIGVLFSCLRLWTQCLLPTVAGHFAADLVAGLCAPRWLSPTANA